jgi:hypothetical protein
MAIADLLALPPVEEQCQNRFTRMAISDIVTERQLTEAIVCDVNLWASCIGGAMQEDEYRHAIEDAGLGLVKAQENPEYHFISDSAQAATKTFGVKSISVLATKQQLRPSAPRPSIPVNKRSQTPGATE